MFYWLLAKLGLVNRWVLVKHLGTEDVCYVTIVCSDDMISVHAMIHEMIDSGYKLVSGKLPVVKVK